MAKLTARAKRYRREIRRVLDCAGGHPVRIQYVSDHTGSSATVPADVLRELLEAADLSALKEQGETP